MSSINDGLDISIHNESIPTESQEDHEVSHELSKLSLSSQTMHADDYLNTYADVAPALHVSTTFRYPQDPNSLVPSADMKVSFLPIEKPYTHSPT